MSSRIVTGVAARLACQDLIHTSADFIDSGVATQLSEMTEPYGRLVFRTSVLTGNFSGSNFGSSRISPTIDDTVVLGSSESERSMLSGQRIMMTGITGQVGGSVAEQLARTNEVFGLARYTAPGSHETVEAMGVVPVVCDYTTGDFTGVPSDIDYVVHVAADTYPASIDIGLQQNAEGTGLLFANFPLAKGWFYTSTTGVYWDDPDPYYAYKETDRCGGSTRITERFHYGSTKWAGEAVSRALSRIHDVPLVIARLNWSYGKAGYGGLPGAMVNMILNGVPIEVHQDWPNLGSPIHEDDLSDSIGPFLDAATVGGTIINWAGDEAITNVELANYIGELIGVAPKFKTVNTSRVYPRVTDNTRRLEVYGPCQVQWREGIRRMIADRHPELQLAVTV